MSSSAKKRRQHHSRLRPRGTPKGVPDPPMWDDPEEFLTQRELATELRISTRQVRELEHHGLPFEGTGREKRYPYSDADAWYFQFRRSVDEDWLGDRRHIRIEDARRAREEYSALCRAYWFVLRGKKGPLDWFAREFLEQAARLVARGSGYPSPPTRYMDG